MTKICRLIFFLVIFRSRTPLDFFKLFLRNQIPLIVNPGAAQRGIFSYFTLTRLSVRVGTLTPR